MKLHYYMLLVILERVLNKYENFHASVRFSMKLLLLFYLFFSDTDLHDYQRAFSSSQAQSSLISDIIFQISS